MAYPQTRTRPHPPAAAPPTTCGEELAEPLASLTRAVLGQDYRRQIAVRDVVAALGDRPATGETQAEEARYCYTLLAQAVPALGGSALAIAVDEQQCYRLFDWAAALAPRLLALLSGHLPLVIGAISELGNGTAFQSECLRELDTGAATGVAMVTELGHGTDAIHLETTATWQPETRSFRLDSPTASSVKFMPNVATASPRCVVVAARLVVADVDEGVWPILVRLRTTSGLIDGAEVVALPDNGFGLWMDNALTRFRGVIVPEAALLAGDAGWFDDRGCFHCELTTAQRFARTMNPLYAARLCMAGAAVSAARAGLALTIAYAARRRVGPDAATMISHDHVARDLVGAMAEVWAMTALVAAVREECARAGLTAGEVALWGMLTKSAASHTAWRVLEVCRERCAAQGILRANYLSDYITVSQGIKTAEGENSAMLAAAGRAVRRGGRPRLAGVSDAPIRSWWHRLIVERERLLATAPPDPQQPDCAAAQLASAVNDRLAIEALTAVAAKSDSPAAQPILNDLTAVYGLGRVRAEADWFTAHALLDQQRAEDLDRELRSHTLALHPWLPVLARSFGLPDLPAPIAGDSTAAWIEFAGWTEDFAPGTAVGCVDPPTGEPGTADSAGPASAKTPLGHV
ncbi:acyl-CoA dehydrogenase family protein [Nocardia brasiliensis]|uniref:acyl-CoA dehydrogenase family protein n=1 Tax=Nocardia brasiliensis TaxID=37326 RepID=UPI00379FF808